MPRMMSRGLSGSVSGTMPREMSQLPMSPARMQRTECSGVDLAQLGDRLRGTRRSANSHRSLKRQPEGRAPGAGVRPGMPLRALAWLRWGIESSSARV